MSKPYLEQADLPPLTRVRVFGKVMGEVRPWLYADEPHNVWGVYVVIDGSSLLNLIHVGHLELVDEEPIQPSPWSAGASQKQEPTRFEGEEPIPGLADALTWLEKETRK